MSFLKKRSYGVKAGIVLAVIFLAAGLVLGFVSCKPFSWEEKTLELKGERRAVMEVPAVTGNEGILGNITTIVQPGKGRVLVGINNIFSGYSTQDSALKAAKAASNFTGLSLDQLDVIYLIQANASTIDGPSAGAAMAVSTVAALKEHPLKEDVIMTGTIDENGSIGRASGVIEKVEAAEGKKSVFLLPVGQGIALNSSLQREKKCDTVDSTEYCKLDYVPGEFNTTMSIVEVSDLEEAWGYFE